jgi:hypothetical protein
MSLFPLAQSYQSQSWSQVILAYNFECPTVETVNIEGSSYDKIFLDGCFTASNPGEPNIPSKGVFILLPPKSKASNIKVVTGEKHLLGTGFNVDPIGQPIPITQSLFIQKIVANDLVYQSNLLFPGRLYTEVGTYNFRGYAILVLLLHPVQYNPVTGELYYYDNMQVTVDTSCDDQANILFRGFERDMLDVMKKVDNPGFAVQYLNQLTPLHTCYDNYDMLILTTDVLKNGFEPLRQAHEAKGLHTVVKTLTDVGSSDPEAIRSYIRDAYYNWGIDYVLLGGDYNIVPARTLWVYGLDEETDPYETYMPSDLYYACLDGPYNYDGDNKWGEPTDGENGGDVDLIAEVYVGRACVDNLADVNNFVTKTITYINKDPDDEYLKKVCLAAEYLGNYGIASYGGTYMDQLINTCTDDGYTTIGIPDDEYNITKLYDSPSYKWGYSEIMSIINNGVHIINHLGHSWYDYNMRMYLYDVSYLTNNNPCFIYSQGCMAGGFDDPQGYDCIAEQFTIKTVHGAFAGIWNARYGFFWSYSTDGDSQRFHRQFWDAVFGENIPEIGKANHDSKEDNLPIIGRSCIRWVYYETNLFGDPALCFYENETPPPNNPPNKPTKPSGPNSGQPGVQYMYTTSTTDPDGDQIYYMWDWGDGNNSGWLGPYASGDIANANHTWAQKGSYQIKVKAKDIYGAESEWSDPLGVAMPVNQPNNQQNQQLLQIIKTIKLKQPS